MSANPPLGPMLDAHAARDRPGYALLVDGPWGAGKTHALRAWMAACKDKPLYVSLYGVDSAQGLENAVTWARLGLGKGAAAGALAGLAGAGLDLAERLVGGDLRKALGKAMTVALPRVVVFDDLERAALAPEVLLGHVNRFVEHLERNVVLLANLAELDRAEGFSRVREKVVGRIVRIEPDADGALTAFLTALPEAQDPARRFMAGQRDTILSVFRAAGTANLRLLRQAVHDFARFFGNVPEDLRGQKAPMRHVLADFVALSAAFHAGEGFAEDDLLQKEDAKGNRGTGEGNAPLGGYAGLRERMRDRPEVRLGGQAIPGPLARDVIARGHAPAESFATLRQAPVFTEASEPDWKHLWWWAERPPEVVGAALDRVGAQLDKGEIAEPEVILHLGGIFLELADFGAVPGGRAAVVARLAAVIDKLEQEKRFPWPDCVRFLEGQGWMEGAHQLGYLSRDTAEFRQIAGRLRQALEQALRQALPGLAGALLGRLRQDPQAVIAALAGRAPLEGFPDLARWPALAFADPEAAAAAVLSLPPETALDLGSALRGWMVAVATSRSSRGTDDPSWVGDWLVGLRNAILAAERAEADPVRRAQIKALVRWRLSFLVAAEGAAAGPGA